jgi:hypothetical protein
LGMSERRMKTGLPVKRLWQLDPDPVTYRIRVQGRLDQRRSDWFEGMTMGLDKASDDMPITALTGPVADQARLRGILSKLWDLNLTLISVVRIEPPETEPEHDRAAR